MLTVYSTLSKRRLDISFFNFVLLRWLRYLLDISLYMQAFAIYHDILPNFYMCFKGIPNMHQSCERIAVKPFLSIGYINQQTMHAMYPML